MVGRKISQPRLTIASANIIARLTHTIHPFDPVFQSETDPGAQPSFFAIGDRMAHPRRAPSNMWMVVAGPMMIPWPTYAGLGLRLQTQVRDI